MEHAVSHIYLRWTRVGDPKGFFSGPVSCFVVSFGSGPDLDPASFQKAYRINCTTLLSFVVEKFLPAPLILNTWYRNL
jgi:hypothetical protein